MPQPRSICIRTPAVVRLTDFARRPAYVQSMGELSEKKRDKLPDGAFAFPKERKEPLTDASHVRAAAARFNQVEDVSKSEKHAAKKRIEKAAKRFRVHLSKEPD